MSVENYVRQELSDQNLTGNLYEIKIKKEYDSTNEGDKTKPLNAYNNVSLV